MDRSHTARAALEENQVEAPVSPGNGEERKVWGDEGMDNGPLSKGMLGDAWLVGGGCAWHGVGGEQGHGSTPHRAQDAPIRVLQPPCQQF